MATNKKNVEINQLLVVDYYYYSLCYFSVPLSFTISLTSRCSLRLFHLRFSVSEQQNRKTSYFDIFGGNGFNKSLLLIRFFCRMFFPCSFQLGLTRFGTSFVSDSNKGQIITKWFRMVAHRFLHIFLIIFHFHFFFLIFSYFGESRSVRCSLRTF